MIAPAHSFWDIETRLFETTWLHSNQALYKNHGDLPYGKHRDVVYRAQALKRFGSNNRVFDAQLTVLCKIPGKPPPRHSKKPKINKKKTGTK